MKKNLQSLCSIHRHAKPGNNHKELLKLQISHLDTFCTWELWEDMYIPTEH